MNCNKCGFTNPEQARFCAGCGLAFAAIECQHCNTGNSPGSKFCNSCGQPLAENLPEKSLRSAHSERRILTVLFCDLVDSTRLVDNLDPELSREIIRDFQRICKIAIEQHGGRVSTYLGDGIVALFSRHESNAERAINTALHLSRKIQQTQGSFSRSNQTIQVRSGIATGLAVVGDDMPGDSKVRQETAIGLPLNLAARIQNLAEPGGVVVGSATHQMTGELFEFEDIGNHVLKGIQDPQQVWRVLEEKSISARYVAHAARMTPMVDRTEILEKLHSCWDKSIHTYGEVVIFTGEPGVGKSRITQQLTDTISIETRHYYLEYQCSPNHTNTALYPIISHLKAAAGFERNEPAAVQIDKLQVLIRESSDDFEHDMPAFLELLSLPAEEKWLCPELDPDEKKEWILSTLINNIFSLSKVNPLLITFEDVHWVDPTTLELLSRMVRSLEGHAILFLITSRPGFVPDFLNLSYVTAFEIESLPQEYAQQLVDQVKGDRDLPVGMLDEIVRRTEGNPLFIEEFSKGLLEGMSAGEANGEPGTQEKLILPATVQESLLARLDRLPEASRNLAHLAAVIGRDFPYDLLESVAEYQGRNLYHDLSPLLNAQLVLQRKPPPNAEFSFKHALVRDVAYETLLKSDRIAIHKRIAEVIKSDYPEILENIPELVARHFYEGEDYEKAIQYWLEAGKKASHQFALIEAREHLENALECLEIVSNNEPRYKASRLEMLIALGPVLMALEGSGAQITREHYSKAVELCAQLPESSKQFPALWGQWLVSKDYQDDHGLVWANKLEKLSQTLNDSGLKLQAHHSQWTTHFHLGDFVSANEFIVKGLQFYDFGSHRNQAGIYGGHDPKVCGDGFLAHVLWFRGDDSRALMQAEESYRWAKEIEHKGSLLHAIELNLLLQLFRRDQVKIGRWYEKLNEICTEQDLPEYKGMLKHCKGQAMVYAGELDEGIREMKGGFEQLSSVGTTEDLSLYGEIIAQAFFKAKRYEDGLSYIDEIITILNSQRVQYWKAEVLRCKGELLAQLNENTRALQYFEFALETSEKQQARVLKLRAAISLFLFDQKTAGFSEGKNTLRRIYDEFEPGTNSPEQEQAQNLLLQS